MKKNATVNMSVSTLVVVILSIAFLLFGLFFIKYVFFQAKSQFEGASSSSRAISKDSNGNIAPLEMPNEVTVAQGEFKKIRFKLTNVYNSAYVFYVKGYGKIDKNGEWDDASAANALSATKQSVVQCYANDHDDSISYVERSITFKTIRSISIKSGRTFAGTLTIGASPTAKPGTYYCTMVIADPTVTTSTPESYASKNFEVTVTS